MPHSKEDQARVLSRRAKVAALLLNGVTNQSEIASRLGLDGDTGRRIIGYDIAAVQKDWRASALRDFDEAREQELARIDEVERQAWQAWERSKVERTSSRTNRRAEPSQGDEPVPALEEVESKKETRDGDPRWLGVILDCVRQRVAVLGLEAPKRVRHGGEEDAPPIRHTLSIEQFKVLPPDEQARVMRERFANWQEN